MLKLPVTLLNVSALTVSTSVVLVTDAVSAGVSFAAVTFTVKLFVSVAPRLSVTFSVKYTQKGTNPQGKAHVIVKSDHNSAGVVDGKVHTYAIDSNAISTLNVTTGASSTADFQAKCNVIELVTNPDNTVTAVSLDGGALMALSLDATNQKIGVTINKSKSLGGMWFSSGWDGKQTVNKPVANSTDAPIKITGN